MLRSISQSGDSHLGLTVGSRIQSKRKVHDIHPAQSIVWKASDPIHAKFKASNASEKCKEGCTSKLETKQSALVNIPVSRCCQKYSVIFAKTLGFGMRPANFLSRNWELFFHTSEQLHPIRLHQCKFLVWNCNPIFYTALLVLNFTHIEGKTLHALQRHRLLGCDAMRSARNFRRV